MKTIFTMFAFVVVLLTAANSVNAQAVVVTFNVSFYDSATGSEDTTLSSGQVWYSDAIANLAEWDSIKASVVNASGDTATYAIGVQKGIGLPGIRGSGIVWDSTVTAIDTMKSTASSTNTKVFKHLAGLRASLGVGGSFYFRFRIKGGPLALSPVNGNDALGGAALLPKRWFIVTLYRK